MFDKFWTADLHLDHEAILRYTRRGEYWSDIKQHDKDIINIINDTATLNSELYIVGDLSVSSNKWYVAEQIDRLHAKRKYLIPGNHDEKLEDFWRSTGIFESVTTRLKIDHHKQHIVMDHHPSLEWGRCHYGSWCLHGHSHGDLDYAKFNFDQYRIFDVGFDASPNFDTGYGYNPDHHGYKPFSFTWLREHLKDRIKLPHHGGHRE